MNLLNWDVLYRCMYVADWRVCCIFVIFMSFNQSVNNKEGNDECVVVLLFVGCSRLSQ